METYISCSICVTNSIEPLTIHANIDLQDSVKLVETKDIREETVVDPVNLRKILIVKSNQMGYTLATIIFQEMKLDPGGQYFQRRKNYWLQNFGANFCFRAMHKFISVYV